jgi:acyl-CoA thioesterase
VTVVLGTQASELKSVGTANTDLTVYLHRQPESEWIWLDATTDVDRRGVGVAHSRLYDERGPIGRSLQGLFIDRLRVTPPSV